MTLRTWSIFWFLCIIWGTPYFFIKVALVDLSPAMIAWSRVALGAVVLVPIAWHRGALRPAMQHRTAIAAFGIAEMAVPFLLISVGERWVSSSLAGVLIATTPMTVVLIAPLFGIREKLSSRRLLGLLIGFVGVVVLLGIDTISGWLQWLGVACMVGAILGYAIGPLIVQRYLAGADELGALAASLGIAAAALLPAALWSAPDAMPSMASLASIAALGVLCTALAMLLYFNLINAAGAARASVIAYVNPAVAALLGVFVLDERFGAGMAAGLALILFGSWLATSGAQRPAPE